MTDDSTPWIKATASGGGGGDCIEMRPQSGGVQVRDSKHPDGAALHFSRSEFAAWLDGARKGEFDRLATEPVE